MMGFDDKGTRPDKTGPALELPYVVADRFELVRELASGGMGTVWLAKQVGLDRRVAVKTLRPGPDVDPEMVVRLRREARAVQRLTHPNTVRIYDFGETEDGLIFLVMEYLRGRTLDRVLTREGSLSDGRAAHICGQVLRSLIEAHAAGVIHRDLKPSNLMLVDQVGQRDFVKVLDFGLARLRQDRASPRTLTGAAIGTPHFMSPEQVRGETVDERTDVYSLGLVLFELVTGTRAYTGNTVYEVATQHLWPKPLELPPELAETALGRIIAKAAEKDIQKRFVSARQMLDALEPEAVAAELPDWSIFPSSSDTAVPSTGELGPDAPSADAPSYELPPPQDFSSTSAESLSVSRRRLARLPVLLAFALVLLALGIGIGRLSTPDLGATDSLDSLTAAALEEPASSLVHEAQRPARLTVATAASLARVAAENATAAPPRLRLNSEPSGAVVQVGDRPVCLTPCDWEIERVEGRVPLTVELPGFEPLLLLLDLSGGAQLSVALQPIEDEEERDEPTRPERDEPTRPERDEPTGDAPALPVNF